MVIGFTTGYQALSFRGQQSMCPVPLSLSFYCHHVVICLSNEAEQPGQDFSVDLEKGRCCGPLIMQRKAGMSLCSDNRRRPLLFLQGLQCWLMTEPDEVMNRGSLVALRTLYIHTVQNRRAQMLRHGIRASLNELWLTFEHSDVSPIDDDRQSVSSLCVTPDVSIKKVRNARRQRKRGRTLAMASWSLVSSRCVSSVQRLI